MRSARNRDILLNFNVISTVFLLVSAVTSVPHKTKPLVLNASHEDDAIASASSLAGGRPNENVEFLTELIHADGMKAQPMTEESIYHQAVGELEATSASSLLNNSSSTTDEAPKFKGAELEERPLIGKLNTAEAGNMLPIFLTEPESVFVVKNRPAELKCKAAHALQLHFKCSGSSQPPPSAHDKHVDPHTGVHLEEVTATIHRDLVDEYFGKGPFKCECHAWSSRGVAKSQAATVNIAYIRKHFVTSPTSLRVEIGSNAELHCEPPIGFPEPKIIWYKNNMPIIATGEFGQVTAEGGTLTFPRISLQDMANYTCSAENIAGKRTSDSAVLIVYVNGGWSPWSSWKDCRCLDKLGQGRKRTRTCTNPIPLNGGLQCPGPQIQKSPDCSACPEDTQIVNAEGMDASSSKRWRWSSWSEWSSCSTECIQVRRRKCISQTNEEDSLVGLPVLAGTGMSVLNSNGVSGATYSKSLCMGKDIQTAECRGEHCPIGKNDFDWTLYLGLAFVAAVFFAFGFALICCARRSFRTNTHYNMARNVPESKYTSGINKKDMEIHIESVNANYDYPNAGHRFHNDDFMGYTEHHYDVPNLSANYTNPIDELSYVMETPDTSTGNTSNSMYNVTPSTNSATKNAVCEILTSSGGSLALYNSEIMLYIPEFAISKSQKKTVSLVILDEDSTRVSIAGAEAPLICSSIIHCAPRNYSFLKPVILKIPHCLVDTKLWNVNIYHADSEANDINVSWRKIISVGEETINTPVFVQLEPTHVYVMTEQLGRFAVVAEAKPAAALIGITEQPSIRMKLIAFSQLSPCSNNYSLRIYVVKHFPNSRHICAVIETQLGGSFMGESDTFAFHLNHCDLNIRVRTPVADASWDELPDVDIYEHLIPYNHILSNSSIMHCEFSIKRSQLNQPLSNNALTLNVDFAQCGNGAAESALEMHSFTVSSQQSNESDASSNRLSTVSVDLQGNYVSDTNVLSSVQLPRVTKRMICAALDPPRADERDWRLLARKLNTDHYIAYFATKPSPTEQILNLWECRASGASAHTIVELVLTLKDMNREDVLDIISDKLGPLWI